jgi:long-subunit fatty acid transport protein
MRLLKTTKFTLGVFFLTASSAVAGGIERQSDPSQILFEEGKNYLEFSATTVHPTVSGVPLSGIPAGPTGNIANDYQTYALGYKRELNDRITLAFVVDEPVGASLAYSNALAFFGGSRAEVSSIAYTGMAKYQVNEKFSFYGGLRLIGVDGAITVVSPASTPSPYNLNVSKDYQVGYLMGVAYEIPDIALRVAATYESKTDHDFRDNNGTPFQVEIPQAVTIHAQTGIASNTLLFGSVRWREWSKFAVQPADFFSLVPGVGPVNTPIASGTNDIWTYELGAGHKFNDSWSGAVAVGYEKDLGDTVGNFAGTDGYFSYGLAVSYEADEWKITTGVRYTDLGSADSSVTAFSGNDAVAAGVKVAYSF